MTKRDQIVALANSTVPQHMHFTYLQIRPMHLTKTYPWRGDCSTYVTWLYWMCGLPDPNDNNYNGVGNTQTLYAKGTKITADQVQPGDVVVYAADQPLQYQHTAIITKAGVDPMTVSMGQQGDPSFVKVSQDGRKPFYVRFLPADPVPTPPPPPAPTTVVLPSVGIGSKDTALVKSVQALLLSKFAISIGADGVDGQYGANTAAAVSKFQTSHNLPVTGVVNGATWNSLLKG